MAKARCLAISPWLRVFLSMQARTRGGLSDSEQKELTGVPWRAPPRRRGGAEKPRALPGSASEGDAHARSGILSRVHDSCTPGSARSMPGPARPELEAQGDMA